MYMYVLASFTTRCITFDKKKNILIIYLIQKTKKFWNSELIKLYFCYTKNKLCNSFSLALNDVWFKLWTDVCTCIFASQGFSIPSSPLYDRKALACYVTQCQRRGEEWIVKPRLANMKTSFNSGGLTMGKPLSIDDHSPVAMLLTLTPRSLKSLAIGRVIPMIAAWLIL